MNDLWKTVMDTVTWLDILVIVRLLYFIIRGAWIGLIRQVAAFLALVGSYVITALYLPKVLPTINQYVQVQDPRLAFLVGFVLLFLLSALCFTLIGKILRHLVEVVFLAGWFDRLMGALLGVIKAFILASLVYMGLTATLSSNSEVLTKSKSTPFLKQGAEVLRVIINDEKLRTSLKEKLPAIPLPGSGPGAAQGKPDKAPGAAQPAGQPAPGGTPRPPHVSPQAPPPPDGPPRGHRRDPTQQPAPQNAPPQGVQGWEPNQQGAPQNAPPQGYGGQPDAQQGAWGPNPGNVPPQGPPQGPPPPAPGR